MNYASPQATHICNCRDNGIAPMFCPTGHLTECHHPLDCREAACSHLPRYDEEMDQSEMEMLEKLAVSHLQQLADPSCTGCNGEGRTEIQSTIPGLDLLQPVPRAIGLGVLQDRIPTLRRHRLRDPHGHETSPAGERRHQLRREPGWTRMAGRLPAVPQCTQETTAGILPTARTDPEAKPARRVNPPTSRRRPRGAG